MLIRSGAYMVVNLIKGLWKRKVKFVLRISLTYTRSDKKSQTEECVYSGETTQTFEDLKRATNAVMSWILTDNKNGIEGGQEQDWRKKER
jgi:hypothetical protein